MKQHPEAAVITSARASRSEDIRRRELRYLLSMGVRTACFVLAVFTSGPMRWVFLTGAVLLPYVAVVIANASTRRQPTGPAPYVADKMPALEGPPPAAHQP